MVINNNNHKNRSVRGTRRRVRVGDKFDRVFFFWISSLIELKMGNRHTYPTHIKLSIYLSIQEKTNFHIHTCRPYAFSSHFSPSIFYI